MFSTDFSIRVRGSPDDCPGKGRVEILNNGKWGLVCANSWDTCDAIVVCREEKLGNNGTALQSAYNQMEILWLNRVECMGNESQLSFCPHSGIGAYAVDDCPYVSAVECFGKGKL